MALGPASPTWDLLLTCTRATVLHQDLQDRALLLTTATPGGTRDSGQAQATVVRDMVRTVLMVPGLEDSTRDTQHRASTQDLDLRDGTVPAPRPAKEVPLLPVSLVVLR